MTKEDMLVDGPEREYGHHPESKYAGVAAAGLAELADMPSESKAESFRLLTWVRGANDKLGYALCVSHPDYTKKGYAQGLFYLIDREERKLVDEPKALISKQVGGNGCDRLKFVADEASASFDKTEYELILDMLVKGIQVKSGATNMIDRDIYLAMADSYLEELAANYPKPD